MLTVINCNYWKNANCQYYCKNISNLSYQPQTVSIINFVIKNSVFLRCDCLKRCDLFFP
eukprot:UN09391